jgi:hypothetical protein
LGGIILKPEKGGKDDGFEVPVSPPQLVLYSRIKARFPTARLNYPIETARTTRYADIAIFGDGLNKEHYLLCVEYDGYKSHKGRKKQDRERDRELAEVGWKTIRVNKKNIHMVFELIEKAIRECHEIS